MSSANLTRLLTVDKLGGGGDQANFLGNINFEIGVVLQGPYMSQHFGWVSGPRRPCLYLGAKIGHIEIRV